MGLPDISNVFLWQLVQDRLCGSLSISRGSVLAFSLCLPRPGLLSTCCATRSSFCCPSVFLGKHAPEDLARVFRRQDTRSCSNPRTGVRGRRERHRRVCQRACLLQNRASLGRWKGV